jgi:hypothetical protein
MVWVGDNTCYPVAPLYQNMASKIECVAIARWSPIDGIAIALQHEFESLGYQVKPFLFDQPIPSGAEMVLSFAPYGTLRPLIHSLANWQGADKPIYAHWNFESIPNPRTPRMLVRLITALRGWSETDSHSSRAKQWMQTRTPLHLLSTRMFKYRYLGDYLLAQRSGALDILLETSEIYAAFFRQYGLQPVVIPWGTAAEWVVNDDVSADNTRDIDVLWMGKRRTQRRSELLNQLRAQLASQGIKMFVIDGEENPLVYGTKRSKILSRTKVTLNLQPVMHDNGFPFRFHIVAPARSMVISEQLQPHSTLYKSGQHFASAPKEQLAALVVHYLLHDAERAVIVENAWQLVTQQLTLRASVQRMMEVVSEKRDQRGE